MSLLKSCDICTKTRYQWGIFNEQIQTVVIKDQLIDACDFCREKVKNVDWNSVDWSKYDFVTTVKIEVHKAWTK